MINILNQGLYNVGIRCYGIGIRLFSLFNEKAGLWVSGRKNWRKLLAEKLGHGHDTCIWIHAASLGEFEQGRPLIEALRKIYPKKKFILTFFSPSGYEVRKAYDQVDLVTYMPLDTKANARDFLDLIRPEMALFIKYEFWFNHLAELKKRKVRTLLVSGRMHAGQGFFKPWGGLFREGLKSYDHFFLQDETSAQLLGSIGFMNKTVTGDTRYDRVMAIREENKQLSDIEQFINGKTTVVLGSSWPKEEELMLEFMKKNERLDFKLIIAPHEIQEARMTELLGQYEKAAVRLSTWKGEEAQVLIIDSIGILAQVYKYGDVALIGGGFGAGIHSVLEPAVWGAPVLFGPRYEKFKEAIGLIAAGGAFPVTGQEDFDRKMTELLQNQEFRNKAGEKAFAFCNAKTGATAAIMSYIAAEVDKNEK